MCELRSMQITHALYCTYCTGLLCFRGLWYVPRLSNNYTVCSALHCFFFVNRHHCTQLESHPICPSQRQGTSSVGETPSWTANAHTSKINCTVRRLQLHLLAYESCKSNGVTIVGRPRFFCFQCWITNCMLPQSVEYILKSRQHSFASCRTPFFTHTLRPLRAERIPHSLKLDWKWRRP